MPTNIKYKPRIDSECAKLAPQSGKFQEAAQSFVGKAPAPRIEDLLALTDFNRARLAQRLVDEGVFTNKENARKNISKWALGRSTPSKANQQRLKNAFIAPQDKGLKIEVSGCYRVSSTIQKTRKPATITLAPDEVNAYLKRASSDDYEAMEMFNRRYFMSVASSTGVTWLSNVTINISYQ